MKYKYIGIDGIDGSGKSTIVNLLKGYLEKNGYKVFIKKEPGPLRDKIIEIIGKPHEENLEYGVTLALLFTADRQIQNIQLNKMLNEGYIVISDRTIYSTFSYQSLYERFDINWLKEISKYIKRPDITFVLDLSAEEAMRRIGNRNSEKTYYERKEALEKIRKKFLELKNIFPEDNIIYIDATKKPEEILNEILSYL
ncbi:MAG: dTMP kinase [Nanopusillaceae archaeon]|jgi:dTMP kinase